MTMTRVEIKNLGTIEIDGVEYNIETILFAHRQIMSHMGLAPENPPVIKNEGEA